MISVGIIGASGYAGFELVSILGGHKRVELKAANANSQAGKKITQLYPHYAGKKECFDGYSVEEIAAMNLDCVFLALPEGLAMKTVPKLLDAGTRVIDLSADYRFQNHEVFEATYGIRHEDAERKAVYGLPELFKEKIRTAEIVANPGCYATVNILAAYPLLKEGLADYVVFDSKSGYSGAGREKTANEEYRKKITDNVTAYNVVKHRHSPEMKQFLGGNIGFTPHVLPFFRGLLTTAHAFAKKGASKEELVQLYKEYYENEAFLQIAESVPDLHCVQNTNKCVLGGFESDDSQRGARTVIVGAIDNLRKGAAGQAVQNMNVMFGFPETEGLQEGLQ